MIVALILLWKYYPDTSNSNDFPTQSISAALSQLFVTPEAKPLRLLLLIFLLLELSWSLYYQAAPLSLNEYYGADATTIGLFMGFAGLWMCVGLGVVYGGLLRITTLPRVLLICMLMSTMGTLICGYLPYFSLQWLVAIPIVLGVGMTYPTLLTLMSNQTAETQQGGLMGLAGATLALAWLITSIFSGILVNIFPALPFHASGWIMLIGLVLAWRWYRLYYQ